MPVTGRGTYDVESAPESYLSNRNIVVKLGIDYKQGFGSILTLIILYAMNIIVGLDTILGVIWP